MDAQGSMGALERLDDPIDTPTKSMVDRHKETHKARGTYPRMGHAGPRDTMVDGHTSSFGHLVLVKGRDKSFVHDGS